MAYPYVPLTNEMCQIAWDEAQELGVLRNSILRGNGNFVGFLGEQAVHLHTGIPKANTLDYDLLSGKGLRVEVKSKSTTVEPKADYLGSVADANIHQECDIYFFTRVHFKGPGSNPPPVGVYILGWLPKAEFYDRAFYGKKGTPETPRFNFKANCWNVPYGEMREWINEEDVWQNLIA